jgi:hypothetical protein
MQDDPAAAEFLRTFRRVMELADRDAGAGNGLIDRLTEHLGADPASLAIFNEEFETFEHPNLQVALAARLEEPGTTADLIGAATPDKRWMGSSLSDLLARAAANQGPRLVQGPVDYTNFHLADGEVLACVQFGLYLVTMGDTRLAAFVTGPAEHGPRPRVRIEAIATDPGACQAFLSDVTRMMRERNVYRGQVLSIGVSQLQFGPVPQTVVQFHPRPEVPRDAVILPGTVLDRIERQALRFTEHAPELLAAGRSLKRGLLLHGLPGTGKTLTVMYLAGQMRDRTVILTTGRSMGMVTSLAQLARGLAPAVLVLEDVDLIAEDRGNAYQRSNPVLFELLNEMDGLRDDADVLFVLTTNRPEILEAALVARPGRVDLVAELPLPDLEGRRRLIELYARGLELEGVDVEALAARTEGATPAYIKELLRKAVVVAAEDGRAPRVSSEDLAAALSELSEGGRLADRLVGLRPEPSDGEQRPPGVRGTARWSGFPQGPAS